MLLMATHTHTYAQFKAVNKPTAAEHSKTLFSNILNVLVICFCEALEGCDYTCLNLFCIWDYKHAYSDHTFTHTISM